MTRKNPLGVTKQLQLLPAAATISFSRCITKSQVQTSRDGSRSTSAQKTLTGRLIQRNGRLPNPPTLSSPQKARAPRSQNTNTVADDNHPAPRSRGQVRSLNHFLYRKSVRFVELDFRGGIAQTASAHHAAQTQIVPKARTGKGNRNSTKAQTLPDRGLSDPGRHRHQLRYRTGR